MKHDNFSTIFKNVSSIFIEQLTSQANKTPTELNHCIVPGGKLISAGQALEVYQRAYIARLTEALGETFEATWAVLGDEGFFTVCKYYILKNGSQSYNLFDMAGGFPAFISEVDFSKDLPFLHDLTQFEWLFAKVFHQKRAPVSQMKMDATSLSEKTKIIFCDGIQFFSSPYRIYSIWKMRKTPESELTVETWSGPEQLSLFRGADGMIQIHHWDQWEFLALKRLHQNEILAVALNSDQLAYPLQGNYKSLVQFFERLFRSGLIADLK